MAEVGICPVCNGTGRSQEEDYINNGRKHGWHGYDSKTDTVVCHNCGAQYQYVDPCGKVRLRPDGTPCTHEYRSERGPWRCTTVYTCKHCGDSFMIDSSD